MTCSSAAEQRLFRCLGVFVGRVSLDAIAAVAERGGSGERSGAGEAGDERETGRTLPRLLSLAEKSLLLPTRPEAARRTGGGRREPEELRGRTPSRRSHAGDGARVRRGAAGRRRASWRRARRATPTTSWRWPSRPLHSCAGATSAPGICGWSASTTTCGRRCAGCSTRTMTQTEHETALRLAGALG